MMAPLGPTEAERAEIARLRHPRTIRSSAKHVLELAEDDYSSSFRVDFARIADVAERVTRMMRTRYANVDAIPYHGRWRHFSVGGVDRLALLERRLKEAGADAAARLRAHVDLVVASVLLDAGAGPSWSYREPGTDVVCGRSEGLALASYHLFLGGALSSDASRPLQADAAGLESITEETLARAFQVTADNPLVGLAGRVELLRRLGATMRDAPLADVLPRRAMAGTLPAAAILAAVLETLSPIWPGRQEIAGVNLGDVWPHPQVGLVPFHKLSQWLTYSLIEPLETAGIRVVDLDALTGLPEYRNGGLFIDAGVLVPKDGGLLARVHAVGSETVVEWRALTVALLDRTAAEVRRLVGADAQTLPLAKVLEAGTWTAGREIAREKRADGGPPLRIESDGTVF
jgi:hypothetical protein